MSLDLDEERYIVFYPDRASISERSLKQIVHENMVAAQLWDEDIPIPWIRYPDTIDKECAYHPLAISVREAFCPDIEEELTFLKDLADRFGYNVYEKTYKFIPQHQRREEKDEINDDGE